MKHIAYINTFERLTRASVKDVYEEGDNIVFVIKQGEIGKAVGKQGSNIRKMESVFKKKIRLIEFNADPCKFLLNLIYPIKVDVELLDGKVVVKTDDTKLKGKIYGRERSNLVRINALMKKYFPVEVVIE